MIDRLAFIDTLRESYGAYYNVNENNGETGLPLVFRADFFSRGEKYWLSKNIKVWANETNEYVYLFSAPTFDRRSAEDCIAYALSDGLPRVKPHKEHNYTNVIVVFVADSFDGETVKYIKAQKFSKSYKFSFYGFTLLKTAAVRLDERKTVTNKAGYDLEKFYRKLFAKQPE